MTDLWTYLKTAAKPIFLYGTGNGADKILNELENREIPVAGVYASDGFVRDRYFRGFKVTSFEEAQKCGDIISLVSFGTQLSEVINNIKRVASLSETYAPDVPVVADNQVFDSEYVKSHREELERAYLLLADDFSKKVFKNIVLYKLTGRIDYLFECESEKSEAYKLLNLGKSEIYIDLGAYNGDTVLEFVKNTGGYKKIIAAEPDKKNFRKLSVNTENLKNIEIYNKAVCGYSGEIAFEACGGRNSAVSNAGDTVLSFSIDDLLAGNPATYIKMDIEGQEKSAISGAEKTIKAFKPKLSVAAYHKNEDLFALPLLLNSFNPEYRIYLRHHPYIPAWDTNYYLV